MKLNEMAYGTYFTDKDDYFPDNEEKFVKDFTTQVEIDDSIYTRDNSFLAKIEGKSPVEYYNEHVDHLDGGLPTLFDVIVKEYSVTWEEEEDFNGRVTGIPVIDLETIVISGDYEGKNGEEVAFPFPLETEIKGEIMSIIGEDAYEQIALALEKLHSDLNK